MLAGLVRGAAFNRNGSGGRRGAGKRCPKELDPLLMLEESGKGLFLIGQLADTVCYNDCGNQITMRLTW